MKVLLPFSFPAGEVGQAHGLSLNLPLKMCDETTAAGELKTRGWFHQDLQASTELIFSSEFRAFPPCDP